MKLPPVDCRLLQELTDMRLEKKSDGEHEHQQQKALRIVVRLKAAQYVASAAARCRSSPNEHNFTAQNQQGKLSSSTRLAVGVVCVQAHSTQLQINALVTLYYPALFTSVNLAEG
ncbi:unnamed protein product [Ceratitis capitata]|uniref:(Mediterranean fruit fly) hypothetical protein n=1 Tax=Ceratitis capitata TaxID=7213 RepID=A0A811V966_CERCA|nr:unnamed protein product [Ceratitis capitata]